jgi:tight adherence protein C
VVDGPPHADLGVIAFVLAAGWVAVVLGGAVAGRPTRAPATLGPRPRPGRGRTELPERVGRWCLDRLGRPADAQLAQRVGTAVLAAAVVVPVGPVAMVPAAAAGWALPALRAGQARRRHEAAVVAALPEAVDLLHVAVGAGLSVGHAVAVVGPRVPGPLGDELERVVHETGRGRRLADALDALPGRAGEGTRALVGALTAAERYGAPLAAGLERLAAEVRADNRRRAEAAARTVPVKLLFPLVLCILPAFGLLTVAPLVASALRALRL